MNADNMNSRSEMNSFPVRIQLLRPSFSVVMLIMGLIFFKPAAAQDSASQAIDSVNSSQRKHVISDTARRPVYKKPAVPKKEDTISQILADTVVVITQPKVDPEFFLGFQRALGANLFFNFLGKPIVVYAEPHATNSNSALFYVLIGILFIFAFINLWYGKYIANLFTLFFRVSMRQHQIREQVLQAPLPSLLLNGLFIISGGMYLSFLLKHYGFGQKTDFWLLFVNCGFILIIIYLAKFLLLKFAGWIFGIPQATDTYIFIVFLTNKILGIFLLPFLIMLSFSSSLTSEVLITLSFVMVFIFYLYRFIVSFGPVRKEIKVSPFHFFLYLCAFEIASLFLIYKVLLTY